MKYIVIIKCDDGIQYSFTKRVGFDDLDNAMNYIMMELYKEFGHGDKENNDMGSLWRCAKEIYDTIISGKVYSYIDTKFWIEFQK